MVAGGAAGAPVGTWTVLFTDQVGSTAMRVLVGEEAFDGVRTDLDARVAAALAAHGVVVTKPTGDGVMGGFTSTAAALRCAVAIQQAVTERNRTAGEGVPGADVLALRVGISVGDAVVDNGDLQGTAVVEAARLCAVADGGMILCSEAVRVVSANRSGCTFGPPRPVELKGLPGPVQAREVIWEALPYESGEHRLVFRVLGPLEVFDGDRSVVLRGPKQRFLLAALLARANSPVSIDALIGAVWGDRPPRTAERMVHAYVARLRRAIEPRRPRGEPSSTLATVGRGYELRLAAAQLDATRFEELAKRGSDQLASGDETASSTLRQALGLWRGEAFGEFLEVEACVAESHRLEELRQALVEDRVDADLAAGQSAELVGEIETLLRAQPFRERLWGQLIVALYRAGRQRDALGAYERARRLLVDELDIEPGPELRRLEAAVRAQDPSLNVLRSVPDVGPSRLPVALDAVGASLLGRETELAWLREAWAAAVHGQGGFVSVMGPEGIGKTRLVAELARKVHDSGAAVLYGRCDHAHRGARALLGQALQSVGSSLLHLHGGGDDADDIAEAVARHLPTWSQGRSVLVVLDDLHLADAETLEVVADLAGWCRASPMLVIGVFHNDAVEQTSPAEPLRGTASQLTLGPLSGDVVARVCDLYATEPWSAEDVDRVYDLTGGVPLLIHEQASEWARERASRRMAVAGDRIAVSRRRLLASRDEVVDGVVGIQRLLEQRRAQLAGREAQLQASAVAALGACPYKGLARFEEADAANFFGRERLVAELVARLTESRLLAVVGPSGSGKSSLVRAGLLPALAVGALPGGQRWRSAILSPGRHPTQALAHVLDGADDSATGPRVIFVDQFEETFTAGADRREQNEFITRLLDLVDRPDTALVLAVRADHLGRCATYPKFADRLTGNDVLVGPMRDAELRRTVELPAQRAGLEVEAGMVEVIVADVAGRAGALPLLSTALAETWERREGRSLTLAGYRAAGGVNGALARMAEDAYAALPAGVRAAVRRLLLRLCDAGEEGDLSLRRRVPVAEVADEDDADARAALETLADHRLLTIDGDRVEVAHEALLREWPRLHTWLDEDVEGRRLHRRLHDAARSWEAADNDPSELYRGTRLGAATEWAASHDDELTHTERAFLGASRGQSEQELADAQRHASARARSNRRLRTLLVGVGVLLLVAVVAGLLAVREGRLAVRQSHVAERRAAETELQRLLAQSESLQATRRDLGTLLALEANHLSPGVDTESALLGAVQADPAFLGYLRMPAGTPAFSVAAPVAGDRLVIGDAAGRLNLFDLTTNEPIGEPVQVANGVPFHALVTDPSGTRLAIAFEGSRDVRLLGLHELVNAAPTGATPGRVVTLDGIPYRLALDQAGRLAVGELDTGTARVIDVSTGSVLAVLPRPSRAAGSDAGPPDGPAAVAFAPDGTLATGQGSTIRLWHASNLGQVAELRAPGFEVGGALEFSPQGDLVSAGAERSAGERYPIAAGLMAWDLDRRAPRWRTPVDVSCLDITVTTTRAVCGQGYRHAITYDMGDGTAGGTPFDLQIGGIRDLGRSLDGRSLVAVSADSVAGLWSLDGRSTIAPVIGGPGSYPLSYSPDGSLLILESVRSGGSVQARNPQLWDTRRFERREELPVLGARFLPDGRLAAVFTDGSTGFLDVETGSRSPFAPLRSLNVTASGYDPVRQRMALGYADGVVDQRDLVTGAIVGAKVTGTSAVGSESMPVNSLAYIQGGTVLAVARGEKVEFFDADVGGTVLDPIKANRVEVSPDGSVLVTASAEGDLTLRDPATGRPTAPEITGPSGRPNNIVLSEDNTRMLVATRNDAAWWQRDFTADAEYAPEAIRLPTDVHLYDVDSARQIGRTLRLALPENAPYLAATLRPDGGQLAVATEHGVQLWDLDPGAWRDAACRLAGRNLSRDEWDRYMPPDEPYRATCPQWPAET
jgi:DNA-binding SARP family transcriptional activator/class 3 adenylate cyclase/WD40 repeat protein/energy-coupling factor transporter ATP-binding protein EcfA2